MASNLEEIKELEQELMKVRLGIVEDEKEFKELAGIIHVVLQNPNKLGEVKEQINSLTKKFPFIND